MQQVSGFLLVLLFPPPIELTATIYNVILLKVALNTINQTIYLKLYFYYRQGVYTYKKGTTAVLKTTQKKLEFEVVRTTVRAEPMET